MSASREKKQRQGAGPDQKALKAQQEQAARKRKTIIYSIVGAVAAVLVIALLVWRTGFFQARATAATVGGEKLSAAQLGYHYNSTRNFYAQYGLIDTSKADDEQVYDAESGKTYRDYFMETALNDVQRYIALEAEAVRAGHTESEVKDSVAANIESAKSSAKASGLSYAAYLKAVYGPYMSASVFEQELTRVLMGRLVSGEKYDELYDSYTQAELEDYYKENADTLDTIEYSYLYFAVPTVDTKDADGNELAEDEVQKLKDEAKAETKEKADAALEAVKGGASFESQADKYELTAATSHGDHTKSVGTSTVNSTFREQLLKLDKDECELVETDNGCYVISFHDRYLDETPTRDVRHILARAESTTGEDNKLVAPTDEAWADAKAKMDEIQAAWDASDKSEDAFAKLANEKSDDGDGTTGGLYERKKENDFVPEFNDWVFGSTHQHGDVGLVQHSAEEGATSGYYGYHLIYYVGENEPAWMGTVRDTLAKAARDEWMDGLAADYPTDELSGAGYLGK